MFNDIYLQADCTNASIASKRSLRTGINVIRGETANKPSLFPKQQRGKTSDWSIFAGKPPMIKKFIIGIQNVKK